MTTTYRLRDGSEALDPRLDRLVQFDERSRSYPIRSLIDDDREPASRWWGHTAKLDQGTEGACVGFAWSHELNAAPFKVEDVDYDSAIDIYRRAQFIDPWPGEDYSGTSVLAGAKILEEDGYLGEYRWAFGIEDVVLTLSWHGPVVLGIPWYEGMHTPDSGHQIRPTGRVVGGHAILALAYDHPSRMVWLLNSWGPEWGWNGLCRISVADLSSLLDQDGEACVPVVRAYGNEPEVNEDVEPEPEVPEIETSVEVEVEGSRIEVGGIDAEIEVGGIDDVDIDAEVDAEVEMHAEVRSDEDDEPSWYQQT